MDSPQSPVVRHPEESGCLERSPLVSESHSRLAAEEQHDLLNELPCRGDDGQIGDS